MEFLTIEEKKCNCTGKGLYVQDCPMGILRLSPQQNLPELKGNTPGSCIRCGHCVAVCPSGALSLATVPLDSCLPVDTMDLPGSKAVSQLLRSRRAIRQYQSRLVPKETLEQIVDISRWAPSAKNIPPCSGSSSTHRKGWTSSSGW